MIVEVDATYDRITSRLNEPSAKQDKSGYCGSIANHAVFSSFVKLQSCDIGAQIILQCVIYMLTLWA